LAFIEATISDLIFGANLSTFDMDHHSKRPIKALENRLTKSSEFHFGERHLIIKNHILLLAIKKYTSDSYDVHN
jgi:hypothetical protein